MIKLYLCEKEEKESSLLLQSVLQKHASTKSATAYAENSHLVKKKQDDRIKNSSPEYPEQLLTTDSNTKDEVNDSHLTVHKSQRRIYD